MTNKRNIAFSESFSSGKCTHAGDYLGAHFSENGVVFRVWAPNAVRVSLVGDFNSWKSEVNALAALGGGIWEIELEGLAELSAYKFAILTKDGQTLWKADPYSIFSELRPASASLLYSLEGYLWNDEKWLERRRTHKVYNNPLNIYELHLGSWRHHENGDYLN